MAILPEVNDIWINLSQNYQVKVGSVQQLNPNKHHQVQYLTESDDPGNSSIELFVRNFRLLERSKRKPCGDHINMESCGLCGWKREYITQDPTERCPYSHEPPAGFCTQCGWRYEAPPSDLDIYRDKLAQIVRDALPYEVQSWGANEKPEWRYRGTEDVDRHVRAITEALIRCQAEWLRSTK